MVGRQGPRRATASGVTQVLHWGAVLAAMNLLYVADVGQMMSSDARLYVPRCSRWARSPRAFISAPGALPGRRLPGIGCARDRLARAVGAASVLAVVVVIGISAAVVALRQDSAAAPRRRLQPVLSIEGRIAATVGAAASGRAVERVA